MHPKQSVIEKLYLDLGYTPERVAEAVDEPLSAVLAALGIDDAAPEAPAPKRKAKPRGPFCGGVILPTPARAIDFGNVVRSRTEGTITNTPTGAIWTPARSPWLGRGRF